MARALVIHYDPDEAATLAGRIRRDGFEADVYPVRGAGALGRVREAPPDVVVIDLMRMPSYGRAMGALLREQKSTRRMPLVFIQGDPEKTRLVRKVLPDAFFTPVSRLGASLAKALTAPPRDPVLPDATRVPPAGKLRIREGSTVCLLHAPAGFRARLDPLPERVRFQAAPDGAEITLLFVKSAARLGRELPALARNLGPGRALWVVWPKRTSGVASDITMPRIIEFCTSLGLSPNKLCAVDQTWSAIGISRRKY
jgi:CheY-like chemotaxis protein